MIKIMETKLSAQEHWDAIATLFDEAAEFAGHPFDTVMIRTDALTEHGIVGRLSATMIYDWLYIKYLVVDTQSQSRGVGKALMADAEQRARAANMIGACTDTFNYQAPRYYIKLGFELMYTISGRTPATDRLYFKKVYTSNNVL